MSPQDKVALSRWENEGGSTSGTRPEAKVPELSSRLPVLPPGYTGQPQWEFTDRSETHHYEFCRVYRPAYIWRDGVRTSIGQLDQNLSYWSVSWSVADKSGEERPFMRWISYAQACRQKGFHRSFEQFSKMCEELPMLLSASNWSSDRLTAEA